jgi:hypothetical protein
MAADKPLSNYEDVFEEGDAPKEAQTVHRIRANSTIMQLNKILGESARCDGPLVYGCVLLARKDGAHHQSFPLPSQEQVAAG